MMFSPDVIQKLDGLLADSLLLAVKLHNYHCHVRGEFSHALSELTEECYDHLVKGYDALAERILQMGGVPLVSVSDATGNSSPSEDRREIRSPEEAISYLVADLRRLKAAVDDTRGSLGDPTIEEVLMRESDFLDRAIGAGVGILSGKASMRRAQAA